MDIQRVFFSTMVVVATFLLCRSSWKRYTNAPQEEKKVVARQETFITFSITIYFILLVLIAASLRQSPIWLFAAYLAFTIPYIVLFRFLKSDKAKELIRRSLHANSQGAPPQ